MNLQQIKTELDIPSLQLNTANDAEGNPTSWMCHWDNERRIAVSIHKDLVAELKEDPSSESLGLQTTDRMGEQGAYKSHRIVKYTPAEEVL